MSQKQSFNNIRNKFTFNTMDLVEPTSNILDQLPSYNSESLDNYVTYLERELQEQKGLNTILKDEDYEKNVDKINTFIKTNAFNVDEQLNKLEKIIPELKNVIKENHELEQSKKEYASLSTSPEAQRIANQMRKIKKLKTNIKFFLQEQGL
jgi:hypothetical protein